MQNSGISILQPEDTRFVLVVEKSSKLTKTKLKKFSTASVAFLVCPVRR